MGVKNLPQVSLVILGKVQLVSKRLLLMYVLIPGVAHSSAWIGLVLEYEQRHLLFTI